MSIPFPSMQFFQALQRGLAEQAASLEDVEPSDAYCGLAIDDSLFVLEFEGKECAAIAPNGNPMDLDFVLAAPRATWQEAVRSDEAAAEHRLSALVDSGAIEIRSEEENGTELAHAALGILQAFLDQANTVDASFD